MSLILVLKVVKKMNMRKSFNPFILKDEWRNIKNKILISIYKFINARSYLKNKFSKTQIDSPDINEPESSIKKKEIKARSSDVIN